MPNSSPAGEGWKRTLSVIASAAKQSLRAIEGRGLAYAVAIAVILCVGIQLGIHRGRTLERETAAIELEELSASLDSVRREVDRLQTEALVLDIIECESGGRHEGLWGDHGRAYGITQAHEPTFNWLAEKAGMRGARWKDRDDQIALLTWALRNGYGNLWSCYKGMPYP